jgi:hypothetical protein
MKLFSKRYKKENSFRDIREAPIAYRLRRNEFLRTELRNRIITEITFSTSRDDFLEFFILFENQKKDKKFLDQWKVDWFSLSELWYKMSEYFQFEEFAMNKFEINNNWKNDNESLGYYFDDYKLFDLIEILTLFSKKDSREELIKRFNYIFIEEWSNYEIINWMIIEKKWENINTLKYQLKNIKLLSKIEDYEYYYDRDDFINTAKISAEILNLIFSDDQQTQKKNKINDMLDKLATKLVLEIKQKDSLKTKINSVLSLCKDLSNNIYNIRHTEQSTIMIKNDDLFFYKLVSNQNISLIELVLMTLKDEYVASEDREEIKENYISKYQINRNERFIIKKPSYDDDLPF